METDLARPHVFPPVPPTGSAVVAEQRRSLEALEVTRPGNRWNEFSAPVRLAPPAGNPGGLTPRSREGLPLRLPQRPFPPTGFPEPEPGARLVHGSDNPRGSPSRSPGQHSTAQTSPRPTTSGTLPSEPPLRPSRLRPRAHVSEERVPC